MKLTLIRGLPGSGKSTHANKIKNEGFVLEADQFFLVKYEYKWDDRFISQAHQWCLARTIQMLRNGHDVLVANTFTQIWELEKYLALKDYFDDLEIVIVEMKTQYKNVHNVPQSTIDKMKNRYEQIPQDVIEKFNLKIYNVL